MTREDSTNDEYANVKSIYCPRKAKIIVDYLTNNYNQNRQETDFWYFYYGAMVP